jgi:hypothetical protein
MVKNRRPSETGAALLVALAILVAVGVFAATLTTLLASGNETHVTQQTGNQAFYMAESGARYAIQRLRSRKLAAVDELDGKSFTMANGWGFELAIDTTDTGASYIVSIDSTGFLGGGMTSQRQNLNGYQVEVPKYDDYVELPTSFTFAIQTPSPSTTTLTGSSYIDSYDSAVGGWTAPGAESSAVIRTVGTEDVLKLTGSSMLYGGVSVPDGTDTANYDALVDAPNYYSDEQLPAVSAEDAPGLDTVTVPPEAPEATIPTSWEPVPDFQGSGSSTIPGGNYAISGDFSTGSTALTVTDDLALDIGKDLKLSGSSLTVEGDLSAWIDRDANLTSWGTGLSVGGDADLDVGRNVSISSSETVVIDGDLDLDAAGDFSISGGGSLHVKGDAYIDVGGSFSISGGGSLIVDGKTIIHVADGLSFNGWDTPITIGENGSVQIYVDDGKITFSSPAINVSYTPDRFVVFGGEGVDKVSITGNATVVGAIHAPSADFTITGSSQLFGAVVADSVGISGSSSIHYDEALSRVMPPMDLTEYPLRHYWVVSGTGE